MEKLNVTCRTCNKGKLFVDDVIRVNRKIGCDECGSVFWASHYSYYGLLRESECNGEEDVRVLNENGYWKFFAQFEEQEGIDVGINDDMEKIHSVKENVEKHYYRLGKHFYSFTKDSNNLVTMRSYRANGNEEVANINAHFEKLTPYPIDAKQSEV